MATEDEVLKELRAMRLEMRKGFENVRGDIELLRLHQVSGFERTTETRIDLADIVSRLTALESVVGRLTKD